MYKKRGLVTIPFKNFSKGVEATQKLAWKGSCIHSSPMPQLQNLPQAKKFEKSLYILDPHSYQSSRIGIHTAKSYLSTCQQFLSQNKPENPNTKNIKLTELIYTMRQQNSSQGKCSVQLAAKNSPMKRPPKLFSNFLGSTDNSQKSDLEDSEINTVSIYLGGNVGFCMLSLNKENGRLDDKDKERKTGYMKKEMINDIRIGMHGEIIDQKYEIDVEYNPGDLLIVGNKAIWLNLSIGEIISVIQPFVNTAQNVRQKISKLKNLDFGEVENMSDLEIEIDLACEMVIEKAKFKSQAQNNKTLGGVSSNSSASRTSYGGGTVEQFRNFAIDGFGAARMEDIIYNCGIIQL